MILMCFFYKNPSQIISKNKFFKRGALKSLPALCHCLAPESEGDILGGQTAERIDNLEAYTKTATATQMGWQGGGSSHTPRLNTLTRSETTASHRSAHRHTHAPK